MKLRGRRTRWSLIPVSDLNAIIIVLVIVILSFANSVNNEFTYDDNPYIKKNKYITSLKYLGQILSKPYPTHYPELGLYRPVVSLSFMVDRFLGSHKSDLAEFGFTPEVSTVPFHVTNIIIHFMVCLAIYLLLRCLWPQGYMPFLSAALFAAHPVHVEVVASIVGRAESLCALFYLLAIYFFLKGKPDDHYYSRAMLISLLCFLLALLSKETAITLPLILIVIEEFRFQKQVNHKATVKRIAYYFKVLLPYLGVLLLYLTIRMLVVGELGIAESQTYFYQRAITQRFAAMLVVFLVYLKILIFPLQLNADYNFPILFFGDYAIDLPTSVSSPWPLMGLTVLVLFATLSFYCYIRKSKFFLPLLCFLITLFPVSNIIPFGDLMAERFLYMPSVGFCLLIGIFFNHFLQRFSTQTGGHRLAAERIWIVFYLIILLFILRCYARNRDWRDELRLCKSVIKVAPENIDAYHGLAHFFADKYGEEIKLAQAKRAMGRFNEADRHLNQAAAFKRQTIEYYHLTLDKDPNCLWAYHDFAAFLMKTEDEVDLLRAREILFQALRLRPIDMLDVFFNAIGVSYLKSKEYSQAVVYFEKAVRLKPATIHYLNGLGVAYAGMKNYQAARQQWETVLQLDPTNKHARNNLNKLQAELNK